MKRIIALVLTLATVLCLFAACTQAPATTNGKNPTNNTTNPGANASKPTTAPTEPTTPTEPTDPTKPTEPVVPTLPGAPVNGDKVHIFLPDKSLALGYNQDAAKPQRMEGVAGSVADGVLTAEGAGVFEIIVDSKGYYTFLCGGKYLTTGETGNSLSLEYDPSEYSLWTLESAGEGTFYIKSSAVYNGQAQYMEYYSGFTTYKFQDSQAPIYTFQFFKTDAEQPAFPPKPTLPDFDTELTIEQLLQLPLKNDEVTSGRYYVNATVVSVTDSRFGAMIITDATGKTISVYNSKNEDGSVTFENMTDKPRKGDNVRLYCTVQMFKDEYEIKEAYIVSFDHNEVDQSKYTAMTIDEARNAPKGTMVKITGVVAQITYATGKVPCGVILVDATGSIYIYDRDLAQSVKTGNTVTVAGDKTMWILESEQANANKFGYAGCNQIENAWVLANDNGTADFDKTWITETTMQELLATPFSTDITTKIFKVTAQVKKVPASGFVNYYFNDLDGITGSYAYTQCNGSDFAWLDAFDGKICTVYLMALNAKSTATGCNWRLLPVAVFDDNFDPSSVNFAENAVKLFAMSQFKNAYTTEFNVDLLTSVNNDLLQYTNAILTYVSSNTDAIVFEEVDGKVVMKTVGAGTATVTVTATHNGVTYSENIDISVTEKPVIDYVNVAGAIATVPGTDESPVLVTVMGIVGPSLVNQQGFYLIDKSGVIAVLMLNKDMLKDIEPGQEVILTGIRYHKNQHADGKTDFGQTCIKDAEIIVNNGGNHPYPTDSFKGEITVEAFAAFDKTVDHTTEVYTMKVFVSASGYTTTLSNADGSVKITLYASGTAQYSWLAAYSGQEITIEIAACNWNSKGYKGAVLAVILEDGTRVINTLNFDN